MRTAFFDLGSNMAVTHNGFEDCPVSHHILVTGDRQERAGKILAWVNERFDAIEESCVDLLQAVGYERPFARGFDATRAGWGIAGIIEAVCAQRKLPCFDVTPQEIKKFAAIARPTAPVRYRDKHGKSKIVKKTSKEKAAANEQEKLLMIARARELGYRGNNEHEADSFLGNLYLHTIIHARKL